jgi:hypothetical protein
LRVGAARSSGGAVPAGALPGALRFEETAGAGAGLPAATLPLAAALRFEETAGAGARADTSFEVEPLAWFLSWTIGSACRKGGRHSVS